MATPGGAVGAAIPSSETAASARAMNPLMSLLTALRARGSGEAGGSSGASGAGLHTRSAAAAADESASAALPDGLSALLASGADMGGFTGMSLDAAFGQLVAAAASGEGPDTGEAPSSAEGVGISGGMMDTLRLMLEGIAASDGAGSEGGSSNGLAASPAAVAALQRVAITSADAADDLPQRHSLLVTQGSGSATHSRANRVMELVVAPAGFGPSPRDATTHTASGGAQAGTGSERRDAAQSGRLVVADPLVGRPHPLVNAAALAGGAIAVFERGVTTFASKALAAQVRQRLQASESRFEPVSCISV